MLTFTNVISAPVTGLRYLRGRKGVKAFAAVLIVFFLLLKPFSAGLANVLSQIVTYQHERWLGEYRVNSTPSPDQIEGVNTLVDWMLGLDGRHPHYLSLTSSHKVWLSIFEPQDSAQHLQAAFEYELLSVERRPTWFVSYINLAKISHYQGKDPLPWLKLAQRYGPYSLDVKSTQVGLVFDRWSSADSSMKVLAMRSLYDLLESDAARLNSQVEQMGSEGRGRACRLVTLKSQSLASCEK